MKRVVGGATRPFPRSGGAEEFYGDQQSGPISRSGSEIKNESAKNGTPKRLRCGIIQEVS